MTDNDQLAASAGADEALERAVTLLRAWEDSWSKVPSQRRMPVGETGKFLSELDARKAPAVRASEPLCGLCELPLSDHGKDGCHDARAVNRAETATFGGGMEPVVGAVDENGSAHGMEFGGPQPPHDGPSLAAQTRAATEADGAALPSGADRGAINLPPGPSPSAHGKTDGARLHALKCWPKFYEAILSGEKRHEVRHDDRGFQVGDRLLLREWGRVGGYTGRSVEVTVTYLARGGECPGLEAVPSHVAVMSITSPAVESGTDTFPTPTQEQLDELVAVSPSVVPELLERLKSAEHDIGYVTERMHRHAERADQSAAALRLCIEAIDKHDEWCGNRAEAPGNGVWYRARDAAKAALAGVPSAGPDLLTPAQREESYRIAVDAAQGLGYKAGYDAASGASTQFRELLHLAYDALDAHADDVPYSTSELRKRIKTALDGTTTTAQGGQE